MINPIFFFYIVLQIAFVLSFASIVAQRFMPSKRIFIACIALTAIMIGSAMLFKPSIVNQHQLAAMFVIIAISYAGVKLSS